MSQNYRDLTKIASEIQQKVAPQGGKIQRILSSPAALCFLVRVPGETLKLYLGRGDGFGGLWLASQTIPAKNRIQDKFLELMRKEMKNAILAGLEVDPHDRILTLHLNHKRKSKSARFFIKRNDLFFAIEAEDGIFKSWVGKRQSRKKSDRVLGSEVFDEIGRRTQATEHSSGETKGWTPGLEELWGEHLVKKEKMGKRLKFLKRKYKKIEGDLSKAEKWKTLKNMVEEGSFPDPVPPHMIIEGVKIPIKGSETRGRVKDLIFEKVKALRRGEEIQRKRASAVKSEIEKLENKGDTGQDVALTYDFSKTLQPVWKTGKNKKYSFGGEQQDYQVETYQVSYYKLAIGRDVRSNDYLRNTWGKREDIWLHIDGEKSSHIVLKADNLFLLSNEQLRAIASLLADKSGYNGLEIPVIYSQLSGVKGVKGGAGKVLIKKPKYLTLAYIKEWPEILARL